MTQMRAHPAAPATGGVPFCSAPVFPLHGGERVCRDRWGKRSVKAPLEDSLRLDDGKVPKHIATDVLALIDRLSPGDGLCHCDLSPGNVIMTAEGPRLVDWTFAMRAPAAVDLGFLHVILSELAPEIADNPERPRATNAAAQSEYALLAGMSLAELTAAMKPYLPIVRTFVVLGDVVPSLRERLIQRIEAGLRPED